VGRVEGQMARNSAPVGLTKVEQKAARLVTPCSERLGSEHNPELGVCWLPNWSGGQTPAPPQIKLYPHHLSSG
jgi:hypothetical protein